MIVENFIAIWGRIKNVGSINVDLKRNNKLVQKSHKKKKKIKNFVFYFYHHYNYYYFKFIISYRI